ncbi:MAG: type II toxin-antitoxin system VapC family toxin [Candidatus Nitrosotenuis sp.]
MKYIDSNVFIYPVVADEKTEPKSTSSKKILLQIATGKLDAATCYLTWDETVWIIKKFLGRDIAFAEGKRFLEFPNLKFLRVDGSTVSRAQEIITKYEIKPRDAIHAACALENGIREMISSDPDFDVIKELKRIQL